MKLFQAFLLATALYAVLFAVLPKRVRVLPAGAAAIIAGALALVLTPSESSAHWNPKKTLALQEIVLAEDDQLPYGRGLVATPALLPLPAFTGKLVAKAARADRMSATWQENALAISVQRRDGSVGSVLCGSQEVHGTRVVYLQDAPVAPCGNS